MRTHAASPTSTHGERKPMAAHAPRSGRGLASAEREREASRKERLRDGRPQKAMASDEDS